MAAGSAKEFSPSLSKSLPKTLTAFPCRRRPEAEARSQGTAVYCQCRPGCVLSHVLCVPQLSKCCRHHIAQKNAAAAVLRECCTVCIAFWTLPATCSAAGRVEHLRCPFICRCGADTNDSHFSIMMGPEPHNDGHYTVFGARSIIITL